MRSADFNVTHDDFKIYCVSGLCTACFWCPLEARK